MVLAAVACGSDGDDADAALPDRTIEVDMADNTFTPANIALATGETVQFVFTNSGTVLHDAFVGDAAEQAEHEAEMQEATEMDHEVTGEAQAQVMPGDEGEVVYTFEDAGTFEIGCHQPDHYLGGMKVALTVA